MKLIKEGGGNAQYRKEVAKELGLVEQTLRNWVKAAKKGRLSVPGGKTVTPEQLELSRVPSGAASVRATPCSPRPSAPARPLRWRPPA